ncbi:hypothetical protein L6452_22796 [Arctium lappa]|uniref:Uncharacterized protein n=1 Tax=Arctium lappa TaxID=4217 RepID=A0ACB9B1R9_ARCLA|nr:hypothetical protein L6452_22796 [Arctium lappa]
MQSSMLLCFYDDVICGQSLETILFLWFSSSIEIHAGSFVLKHSRRRSILFFNQHIKLKLAMFGVFRRKFVSGSSSASVI